MKYPQFITAFILFAGLFFFNDSHAQAPCTFTYQQGMDIGCQIARAANRDGCYSPRCANALLNTIRDFQADCPEYVSGVIDGFTSCNTLPAWQNNVTNDPTDPGNNIIDPPCENAVYTNGNWDCP